MLHTCGAIYPFLKDIVKMGVDILNPVQCNAEGMEPGRLKSEFGNRLIFWGGGVDTQTFFTQGTAEEVKKQVQERISILGKDGGYIFAPTQDILAEVPTENIIAMFDAVHENNIYK